MLFAFVLNSLGSLGTSGIAPIAINADFSWLIRVYHNNLRHPCSIVSAVYVLRVTLVNVILEILQKLFGVFFIDLMLHKRVIQIGIDVLFFFHFL